MNIYTLVVSTLAGSSSLPSSIDGIGTNAKFNNNQRICTDISNNVLYIADVGSRRIRKLDLATNMVTTLAGSSQATLDGVGTNAKFLDINGMSYDGNGILYVSDRDVIRKIDVQTATVTTLVTTLNISTPQQILCTPDGNMVVISGITGLCIAYRVTPTGVASVIAEFPNSTLGAMTFDTNGNIYISDQTNNNYNTLYKIT